MTRKELIKKLSEKKIPGGLWFLYGPDRYSIRKAVAAARELADEAARELNVSELEGPSLPEIWSAVDALPFFSERRVVIVEKPDIDTARALWQQKERIPDSTVLFVIQYGKVKKEWQEIFDADRVVEFKEYAADELSAFFDACAAENGLKVEPPAKAEFLKRTGSDLAQVENYIKLLTNLPGPGKPVTVKQVETYLPEVVEEYAWYIMDDFLAGNFRHGIAAFENLYRDDPGSVFMVLGYMVKRCGQMVEAKRLLAMKKSAAEIAGMLGIKPNSVGSVITAAKKPTHAQLQRILRALCRFDHDLKQGAMNQHDAFFLALCRAFMDETEEDTEA